VEIVGKVHLNTRHAPNYTHNGEERQCWDAEYRGSR
jgi:hypothetical protein